MSLRLDVLSQPHNENQGLRSPVSGQAPHNLVQRVLASEAVDAVVFEEPLAMAAARLVPRVCPRALRILDAHIGGGSRGNLPTSRALCGWDDPST
jgi:hypothetical protein